MSRQQINITDALATYIRDVSVRESDVLGRLRQRTATLEHGAMQVSPELGQFLRLIVLLMNVRRAVEIGTFTGYSSTCIALGMPSDGRLICCDRSDEWTSIARETWHEAGVENRIELRLGPALETLDGLLQAGEAGHFDFAFIDADKTNYRAYLDRVHTLLRPGGLVMIDNVLWSGRVLDPAVTDADTAAIRTFNVDLARDARFAVSLLPLGDGVTLALKL